jgi:hypothetical protein
MSEPELSPCATLLRRGDPDRFLSAMTAPPDRRERLFALYAFNLELARIRAVASEPMLGLIRLQWWRETVEGIYAGAPRAHEVVGPLAETIAAADLPQAPFQGMIDARGWDVEPEPFADAAALRAHLQATGGALLALAAQALAGRPVETAEAGFAFAAAAWLRAAPALSAQGAPPWPPGDARDRSQALAREGLAALDRARAAPVPPEAAPAFRAGWRSRAALRGALAADFDPAIGPAEESPFRRRAGLLWRAALGRW